MRSEGTITITSVIKAGDDKTDMSFSSPCKYKSLNDKTYVFYNEYISEGSAPTRCRLSIEKDLVSLKKDGEIQTLMVFDPKNITAVKYRTPLGCNQFFLKTFSFKTDSNEDPTRLELIYDLTDGDIVLGSYKLSISLD